MLQTEITRMVWVRKPKLAPGVLQRSHEVQQLIWWLPESQQDVPVVAKFASLLSDLSATVDFCRWINSNEAKVHSDLPDQNFKDYSIFWNSFKTHVQRSSMLGSLVPHHSKESKIDSKHSCYNPKSKTSSLGYFLLRPCLESKQLFPWLTNKEIALCKVARKVARRTREWLWDRDQVLTSVHFVVGFQPFLRKEEC